MGMRTGAYATIWEVSPQERYTKIRLSTSKKNRETGEYEQDFSGFCNFIGNAHALASKLKVRDRIKIKDFEVTTRFDKERKITYTNYSVFDFEPANSTDHPNSRPASNPVEDNDPSAEDLPF